MLCNIPYPSNIEIQKSEVCSTKASFFRLSVYTDCSQIFGPKMIQPASKHEVSPISRLTAKWWVQCRCLDLCQAVIKLWLQIIIDYFAPTHTTLIVTESNFVRYAWQPWFRVQGACLKTTHWTHFRGVDCTKILRNCYFETRGSLSSELYQKNYTEKHICQCFENISKHQKLMKC